MKILMVCLGNICRSPLAEGIMRSKIQKYNLPFVVDSAGTGNWHQGEAPDHRSIKIAAENGIDISKQIARGFVASDFDDFDIIYAMDQSNHQTLFDRALNEQHQLKIKLLLKEANYNGSSEVPDPYYGNMNDFRQVFEMLNKSCEDLVQQWNSATYNK
jgi:protein-tyrosine phosphatase